MIKTIAAKIIASYFGKFIKGVSKENLQVNIFAGTATLSNISINNQLFDNTGLPFQLAHSFIRKLNLEISVSKLGSTPVTCTLEDVFLIFKFKEKAFVDLDKADVEKTKEILQEYAKDCLEKFKERMDTNKEQGMFAKIGKKVIDNLQLKVNNIHVRFEEDGTQKKYAWGVTLKEIEFVTTNEKWQQAFIDRSLEANKNAILYKKMHLKSLGVYWSFENIRFILQTQNINEKMQEGINIEQGRIISISSQLQLKINPLNHFQTSVYELKVSLSPINISITQGQLSQMIDFMERIVVHNELKYMFKKKAQKSVDIGELHYAFKTYIRGFLDGDPEYTDETAKVLDRVPMDQLMIWTINQVKSFVRNQKIHQLEKKKKGGWFSSSEEITKQELSELESLIQTAFEQQTQSLRPPSCPFYTFCLSIPSGEFNFSQLKDNQQQTLKFMYSQLIFQGQKSSDDSNLKMMVKLSSIALKFFQAENIYSIIESISSQNQNFFELQHSKKMTKDLQQFQTKFTVQQLIGVYRYLFIKKFREFFTFRSVDEVLKSLTLEKIENMQTEKKEQTLVENKNKISATIKSPVLLIPFTNSQQSQCWACNLGNFSIETINNSQDIDFKSYQHFNIKLQDVSLVHLQNMAVCYHEQGQKNSSPLVNNINLVMLYKQRKIFVDQKKFFKDMFNLSLDTFTLRFTHKQYGYLMQLIEVLRQGRKSRLEQLKRQKDKLESVKTFNGKIRKRNNLLKNWTDYYAILSGPYIYFYNDKRDLKYVQQAFIKNSKVQFNQNNLQIVNKYQHCTLTCNIQQLEDWKIAIEDQVKRFATNVQFMDLYSEPDQKSVIKKSYEKQHSFVFHLGDLDCHYEDKDNKLLAAFKLSELKLENASDTNEEKTTIGFKSFSIADKVFEYADPNNQTFISIQQSGSVPLVQIVKFKQSDAHKGEGERLNVSIIFPMLKLNWKPDVILLLIGLTKKHLQKEQTLRENDYEMRKTGMKLDRAKVIADLKRTKQFQQVDEGHNKSDRIVKYLREKYLTLAGYQQLSNNKYPILFNMIFDIKTLQCQLFHRQSHVQMFKLSAENIRGDLSFTQDEKFLTGSIEQVQLFQMFNYPKTTNSNLQYASITPHLVLGRKGKYQKPTVEFKWSSYQQKSFFNKQRVNGFLLLSFNPVNFYFYQQVTFRAIDYCLIQIIMLLTNPDQVVANEGLLEQLKNGQQVHEQAHEEIMFVWGKFEEITKKLLSPFFFDICIELEEPTIILESEPNTPVYFQLNSKRVKLTNETFKRKQRFLDEPNLNPQLANSIWEQQMNIMAEDLYLKIIQYKEEKDLWLPVDLKMNINKLLNEDEIRHIFPETSVYNRGFRIKSSSNQIKLNLNKFQYLQVLKLLNFNITFEDERDELFIHNYKITKLLSPKPIDFKLIIPSLLFTADYAIDSRIDTLFSIYFEDLEIEYRRNKELTNHISLITPSILLCSSRDGIDTDIVKAPEENLRQQPIKLDVEMKPNGQKIVTLYFQSAKMILKIQLFQLIFQWALVQEWIFPVQSPMVHPILFITNVNRVIVCLESETAQQYKHGFAALGTLSFKFSRKRNRTEEWYRQEIVNKRMTIQEYQQKSELSKMSVSLNIQLCRCRYQDFLSTPFNNINKRTIIYPITLNYSDNMTRTLSDTKLIIFNNTSKKSINADKATIKIATKDIFYLTQLWNLQMKQDLEMKKVLETIKQLKYHDLVVNKQKQQERLQQNKHNEISTLATIDVNVSTISIVLINNYNNSFVPLINPIVENLTLNYFATFKKSILELKFQLLMNHFNGQILRWQPILQKVVLSISYNNHIQYKKQILTADGCDKIRFAINKECLQALSQSAAEWKNTKHQQPKSNQPVEFISHYIIVNQTGYPIDIFTTKGQLKNKINTGQQESYDVEIGQTNLSDQNTSVNIIIKHPKAQFQPLREIQLNSNKVRRIATSSKKELNKNYAIVIRPKYENLKQYVYISGGYVILDCTKEKPLPIPIPFDQNISSIRLAPPHNIELSLDRLREPIETKLYRYSLTKDQKDRIYVIKINFKSTATNFLPIPININGNYVNPNRSVGFEGELMIQGQKYNKSETLKTFINKNQVSIFCQAYIIDYYGLDIAYSKLGSQKPINAKYICVQKLKNGNANIVLIHHPRQKLAFKLRNRKSWSKSFTPSLGKSFFKIVQGLSQMEFAAVTKIKSINDHSKSQRLVTVIQITPRYIIVNSSHHRLKISQSDSVQSTVLEHGEREPFFWENTKKSKFIKICSFDEESMWGYSGPIDISMDFHCFYLRKAENSKQYKIFMVQLQHTTHITYINITSGDSPYQLQNDLKEVQMLACQGQIFKSEQVLDPKELIIRVNPGQSIPFAYEFPSANKNIIVTLNFLQDKEYQSERVAIDLETVKETRILVSKNKKPVGYYNIICEFEGNIKKLKLTEKKKIEEEQQPHLEITVKVPEISLSLIGKQDELRKELLYFAFEEIVANVSHTNKTVQYSLYIKNCRIQNQRLAKPMYPVMLQASVQPFIQFILTKDPSNNKLIHYIGLSLNKSSISLTSDEFAILHQNINQMSNSITGNNSLQDVAVTDYDFYRRVMSQRAESFYFKKAEIHPFQCKLNFKNVGELGGHVGKTFANVSQAAVRTDGINLSSFSCKDLAEFLSTVLDVYKQNIVSTVLPLIGNIAILGNPTTLFTNIGSGFKDLVMLPAKGFEVSPLEGGKGIGRGVKSLFQKTVQGTFNSVEAIGDTIGTGLASLTFDQKFQKQRDRIRNTKSQDVLDGLMNGGKSLLNGIGDGFIGLIRNPIQGAEQKGIGGFFLGAAKGISGLIIKPISGLVDFTAKTAQGIKNTTQSSDTAMENTRQHLPRVFYTPSRQYRAYDQTMAQINNFIELADPIKYSKLSWCGGSLIGSSTYLAITYQYLVFLNLNSYLISKQFESRLIISCNEYEELRKSKKDNKEQKHYFVFFLINKKTEENGELRIPVQSKEQARIIAACMRQVILYHHSN